MIIIFSWRSRRFSWCSQ